MAGRSEGEIVRAEDAIFSEHYDFTGKYMAVCQLDAISLSNPEMLRSKTISGVGYVLY